MNPARFLFFAQAADWVKTREIRVALERPVPLSTLLRNDRRFFDIHRRLNFLRVAVNHELSNFEVEVQSGDEVAFFPPFSGG